MKKVSRSSALNASVAMRQIVPFLLYISETNTANNDSTGAYTFYTIHITQWIALSFIKER